MKFEIIARSSNLVHDWSGGQTSEILLIPRDSAYQDKNFDLRVSTAFTRVEGSLFTDFTGYTRFISPLRGTLELHHKGQYSVTLKPYEIDQFDGAWETSSKGMYTDFNFLIGAGWKGTMRAITTESKVDFPAEETGILGFFASEASVQIQIEEAQKKSSVILDKGDFLFCESPGETVRLSFSRRSTTPSIREDQSCIGFVVCAYQSFQALE